MTKPNGWKAVSAVLMLSVATAIAAGAQSFTTLAAFDGQNGSGPDTPLVQAIDGTLYGTTYSNSADRQQDRGYGVIFRFVGGELATPHGFCSQKNDHGYCIDGAHPVGILQADGNFFVGTTDQGGANDYGTVFKCSAGKLTTLHSFDLTDGAYPGAGLVQAANGNFYGTTAHYGSANGGTIFRLTAQGTFTTLYNFCSQPNCPDGSQPTNLIQSTDGNFYGATEAGGKNRTLCASGCGTVFKVTPAGKLTTLYNFCNQISRQGYCADGAVPVAGLVQASDGNLYGTTEAGGTENCYNTNGGCGTIFRITKQGVFTILYSFCTQTNGQGYCTDGSVPVAGLIQATNGTLYGATYAGGDFNGGTVFGISTQGIDEEALYSFDCTFADCSDGASPGAALLQATDGKLYGTTLFGGNSSCSYENSVGCGTLFEVSLGLNPFVKTLPAAAGMGAEVGIQGTDLTGANGVTFNGIPAQFSVRLPSLIVTRVPPGATTGYVTVTMPSGTLTSNVPFHVIP